MEKLAQIENFISITALRKHDKEGFMKKVLIISIFVFLVINSVYAQNDTPPAEVVKTANDNFITYLTNAVPENAKTLVGFSSNDNLSQAVLGTPFKIYNLSADSIKNYNGTASLRSIVTETNMWYFPIMINDTVKMIMYIGKMDSVWVRAGLGSAGLAREMQNITTQWPLKNGYAPMIIQQYNIGNYLYSIPQVDSFNLTETNTSSDVSGLSKRSTTLNTLKATIGDLQKRINR